MKNLSRTIAVSSLAFSAAAMAQGGGMTARSDVTTQQQDAAIDLPSTFRNVDVTQDIGRRFGAPHIAVNPTNPNNIVVLASSDIGYTKACLPAAPGSDCELIPITAPNMPRPMEQPRGFARTPGFMDIGVFVSFDRGESFKKIDIADLVPPDDPRVRARGEGPIAVTPEGDFYIGFNAIHWGDWESTPQEFFPNGGVGIIKSTDGGLTWEWTSYSHTPANWPYGGADLTTGRFYVTSGIAGLTPLGPRSTGDADSPVSEISDRWVSSTEDGYEWTEPQPLGGSDGDRHIGGGHTSVAAAHGVMATMFVSADCEFFTGSALEHCVVFQTSADAGKSWSRSRVPTPADFKTARLSLFVAADPRQKGAFVATLMNETGEDFLIYRTIDEGRNWNEPVRVAQGTGGKHFAPYVAMSPDGVFGLMWRTYESDPANSDTPAQQRPYSVWATVSKDGGESFSEPVRVSRTNSPAAPSDPDDYFRIVGDHGPSGMAIDSEGGVHVVWADWGPGERAIYLGSTDIKAFED